MESQLQLCRDLFSALLNCQDGSKAPASFNAALLHACQRLMLEAVQLQQVRDVHSCFDMALYAAARALQSRTVPLIPIQRRAP